MKRKRKYLLYVHTWLPVQCKYCNIARGIHYQLDAKWVGGMDVVEWLAVAVSEAVVGPAEATLIHILSQLIESSTSPVISEPLRKLSTGAYWTKTY